MSKQPLVSILIPAFNVEAWLAETIESTLSQTWQNTEIIIVDDGSTDNTLAIAKSFASSKVKVISQENRGQSASENRAFQEAQGDFIEYLDADDLLAPDKIEQQIRLLDDCSSEFVASGEWARFYTSPDEALFIPQPLWVDMSPVDWLVCAWENHLMMHGAAWLIPRSIAERAGNWDERLSLINDFDYFSRILLNSQGVKFCQGAKTYYRSGNTTSLSGSKSRRAWDSAFLALELGTSNLLAQEDSPRTRHACATVFQRFIYEVYPDVPDILKKAEDKVKQFGGSDLQASGGPMFQLLSSCLGWQKAKKMQRFFYQYGYAKAALGWKFSKLYERSLYLLKETKM
ncbi:glycosyltransferase family 2 protein [Nostoc spongiaeforme FACHB-130]|uniref:Glycosyltransferase family 2 protein n=1 Tax=Nostoc spongiaeforme FACHB-130 TaxID=1357510 RepID=A0ABR8FRT7_9NOSO|nr:glycosyltransferase family 2 protein [Nostoc spongiaeforme]MBD2593972.1 glycosyltransferase family 2 protein [Nostoc spongiaeforme FACHB-130]